MKTAYLINNQDNEKVINLLNLASDIENIAVIIDDSDAIETHMKVSNADTITFDENDFKEYLENAPYMLEFYVFVGIGNENKELANKINAHFYSLSL